MILAAVCFTMAMSILWTIYALAGGCKHQSSLTDAQITKTTRLNWISQPMCVGGLTAGKISVACLIYRLQSPTRWRTKLLIGLCSFMVALNSVCIILMFTQCRPVELLWDHSPTGPKGHCIDHNIVARINQCAASYMAFLNLALATIAVHMIWNLQMHPKKKFAVCCLLSTGVPAFAFAILIVVELQNDSNHKDLTWATVMLFVWNAIDINLVIIAACIPTIVPVFEIITGRKHSSYFAKSTSSFSNSNGGRYGINSFVMRDRAVRLRSSDEATEEGGILVQKTVKQFFELGSEVDASPEGRGEVVEDSWREGESRLVI
ncbi:hypothetical protein B0O99DRAFT_745051 [Bisporella sp. PMI_857]|nr:hypothetical protein B0O99DRAFT_745051 [Bisporella sp. PMI_857]